MTAQAPQNSAHADPYDRLRAVDSLRNTATWLLSILAAIGGALIAGTQLSNIGHLNKGDWRLWVAGIALLIALLMVGIMIKQVVTVLTPTEVNLHSMREDAHLLVRPVYLVKAIDGVRLSETQFHTIDDLYLAQEILRREFNQIAPNTPPDPALAQRREDIQVLRDRLTLLALYYKVRISFTWAVRVLLFGGLIVAIAVATFAWAAYPPAETPQPFLTPALVRLTLSEAAAQMLVDALGGPRCVKGSLQAIALNADTAAYDLVSLPRAGCKIAKFKLYNEDLTSVQPGEIVAVPTRVALH